MSGGQLMMRVSDAQQDSAKWLNGRSVTGADSEVASAESDANAGCDLAMPGCVAFQNAAQHAGVAVRNLLSAVGGGVAAYRSIAEYCAGRYETADAVGRKALNRMIDTPTDTGPRG